MQKIYNFDIRFYTNRDIIGSYNNPAKFPLWEWKGLYNRSMLQIISLIQEQIKHERHQS